MDGERSQGAERRRGAERDTGMQLIFSIRGSRGVVVGGVRGGVKAKSEPNRVFEEVFCFV
jgi:hypothetical protein